MRLQCESLLLQADTVGRRDKWGRWRLWNIAQRKGVMPCRQFRVAEIIGRVAVRDGLEAADRRDGGGARRRDGGRSAQREIVALLLAATILSPPAWGGGRRCDVEAEGLPRLIETFHEYRTALYDAGVNASVFFSKRFLETELEPVLAPFPAGSLEKTVDVIRSRLRFGDRVHTVYACSEINQKNGQRVLALVVDNAKSGRPMTLRISYVFEERHWVIDFLHFDATSPGTVPPGEIVEAFR
jgi:hypothetical protein